jgi:arylsulfatase A-like enzyme
MKLIKKSSDLLLFCGIWTLFRALPFLLVEDYTAELELHHRYEGGATLIAIACLVPILWATEAFASLMMYSSLSRIKNKALRLASMSAFSLLLLIYFSLQTASWGLYQRTGFFSTLDSLHLASIALDIRILLSNISASDLSHFLLVPLIALVPVALLFFAHTLNACALQSKKTISILTILLFAFVFLPATHFKKLTPKRQRFFQSLLHNFVSPDMSLVWAPLWLDSPLPGFEKVELDLERMKSPPVYMTTQLAVAQKNVLLISIEALRADMLAAYGNQQSVMPFIDSIGKESTIFKRAYAQGAETAYSQTTIVSSLHPLKFPYRDVGKDINYPIARIYDILSDLGYQTAYLTEEWSSTSKFTKSEKLNLFLNPAILQREALRQYLPDSEIKTDKAGVPTAATTDRANLAALKDWLTNLDSDKPFFASLYLFSSHYPFNPPDDFTPPFTPFTLGNDARKISFLGYPEEYASVMKNRYMNALRFIDGGVRSLFGTLKELQRLKDTVVIVTGDHGSLFHEHGLVNHAGYLYEEVSRVPLLVYGAEGFYPVDDGLSPVGHIDITPTILSVLNLPPHPNHQGTALLYQKEPEVSLMKRPLFSTVQLVVQEDCVLLWPWKYCFNWREQSERLFNLQTDSQEKNNQVTQRLKKTKILSELLLSFRNRQLTYYAPTEPYRSNYYPPKITANKSTNTVPPALSK